MAIFIAVSLFVIYYNVMEIDITKIKLLYVIFITVLKLAIRL